MQQHMKSPMQQHFRRGGVNVGVQQVRVSIGSQGWYKECCWAVAEEEEQRKFSKSGVKRKRREAGTLEQWAGSSNLSQDN
ncbi:hypothetical protein WN943_014721 [Citrus x changshan-huyou]